MIHMPDTPIRSHTRDLESSKQFLDAITDMVLIKGGQSHIVWANKAFRDYYNMDNEKLLGMIDSSISEPDFTQQYIRDDEKVFTTGVPLDIPEEPVVRFDGITRYFHTVKSPILDDSGKVIMTIGVSRDVTDEKAAKELLHKRNKELEDMNKFMISRELKMVELKKENGLLKHENGQLKLKLATA
jgi:two-component system, NtrC family, sensor kinase